MYFYRTSPYSMDDMVCLHEMYAWALAVGFHVWVFLTITGFMYMNTVIEVTQQQVEHLKFELEHNVIRVNQSRSTTEVSSNDESENENDDEDDTQTYEENKEQFTEVSNEVNINDERFDGIPDAKTRGGILQRLVSGWGGEPVHVTAQDIIQSNGDDKSKDD